MGQRLHVTVVQLPFRSIPHEARIEGFSRKNREYDNGAKRHGTDAGLNGDDPAELNEGTQKSLHEDVDHRPATDPVV